MRILLTIFVLLLSINSASAKQPPNILFIAVDDLKPLSGAFGIQDAITPNIDALANSGAQFNRAYSQWPVCGPSRMSLLTGQRPETNGIMNLSDKIRDVNPNVVTLPQKLKQNGYHTSAYGKIFDSRNVDASHDAVSWSQPYSNISGSIDSKTNNGNVAVKAIDANDEEFVDGKIAAAALTQLENLANTEQPFFLGVGFKRPHLPFYAPKSYFDQYNVDYFNVAAFNTLPLNSDPTYVSHTSNELVNSYCLTPGEKTEEDPCVGGTKYEHGNISVAQQKDLIHGYYATTSFVDAQVGLLIAKLEQLGLSDNTVIVFWGDHGFSLGEQGEWGKHTVLEQANRVPVIIKVPGQAAIATDALFELTDIYPTILDIAGLNQPSDLDGVSQLSVIKQQNLKVRDVAISQYKRNSAMGYSMRTDTHRYNEWWHTNNGTLDYSELYAITNDLVETENTFDSINSNALTSYQNLLRQNNQGLNYIGVTNGDAKILSANIGQAREVSPYLFGFNGNMMTHLKFNPWNKPEVNELFAKTHANVMRYPGGTIANHFDWTKGVQFSYEKNEQGEYVLDEFGNKIQEDSTGDYKLENFKVGYDQQGFMPIYVVNILTKDLQHTLDGLAQAKSLGLPVEYIEMGNEFYLGAGGFPEYTAEFPTGAEYGTKACAWIEQIRAIYPDAKFALNSTMSPWARDINWHEEILSTCTDFDASIIHSYPRSGITTDSSESGDNYWGTTTEQQTQWTNFNNAANVDSMLAQPFVSWQSDVDNNNLPEDEVIWITEFNFGDSVGPTRNTWAHALFNANQIQSYLNDGRVEMILMHNLITGAKEAGINNSTIFNGLEIDHGQGDLSAQKYDLSASGHVMAAFGQSLNNMSHIAPLEINESPQVNAGGGSYDAVYGWQGSNANETRYIIVNTSSVAYSISTANITPSIDHVEQFSSTPQAFVTSEELVAGGFSGELPEILHLPAHSITTIGATAPAQQEVISEFPATLFANDDHQTSEASPSGKGDGAALTIPIRGGVGTQYQPHIKFDISALRGQIGQAKLRVKSDNVSYAVTAHLAENNWDEYVTSWNTRPIASTQVGTVTPDVGAWFEYDVTGVLNSEKLKGKRFISFVLSTDESNTAFRRILTKEAGFSPELVIDSVTNTPLTIQSPYAINVNANSDVVGDLTGQVTDIENDTLTFNKVSGPSWLTIFADGSYQGTARLNNLGLNSFVVEVSDGYGPAQQLIFDVNVSYAKGAKYIANEFSVTVAEDTYVKEADAVVTDHSAEKTLHLRQEFGTTVNQSRIPYLKFNVPVLNGAITSTRLFLHSNNISGNINVHQTNNNWDQTTLFWQTKPAVGELIATATAIDGEWFSVDVTSYINSEGTFSIALDEQSNDYKQLHSKEGGFAPYLLITTNPETPQAPNHYVKNVELTTSLDANNQVSATAVVTVVDDFGLAISNAMVSVTFKGNYRESMQGITDENGQISFTSPSYSQNINVSVQVDAVSLNNSTYNPSLNEVSETSVSYQYPQIEVSPTHVFVNGKQGENGQTQQVSFTNKSGAEVNFTNLTITGFDLLAPNTGLDCNTVITLADGESCSVVVKATMSSPSTGILVFNTDASMLANYPVFISQHISAREEAVKRIAPVLNNFTITNTATQLPVETPMQAQQSYLLDFWLDGYDPTAYVAAAVVFECADVNNDCATNTTGKLASVVATPTEQSTGSLSFKDESSQNYRYQAYFTLPEYTPGNSIVLRLYYKTQMDNKAGNRYVSVVIPGGQQLNMAGDLGRKIILSQ
ncbi:sulfatase-like hydrolase/transferase [Thalassomonas sp. M1454]|uniref:sulfatase-like hydrolase/transferase n=1 Tax=Thalassomonas sp. M1454 TaxID=2594477 RepID=UPI00163D4F74|nr:sulfatase-like hydrolase/transferase [Thalassomonas sp. M1454]